jgi:hypothetical protein
LFILIRESQFFDEKRKDPLPRRVLYFDVIFVAAWRWRLVSKKNNQRRKTPPQNGSS